jgi:hypothetical protein
MTPASQRDVSIAAGPAHPGHARSTVNITAELLAVTRAAVRLVRTKTGRPYSLRQFTEEALTAQIRVVAHTYNDGHAIPPDETPLEKGAPGR